MSNRRTEPKSRRHFLAGGLGAASGAIVQPCPSLAHAADNPGGKSMWTKVLELNEHRKPVHGSTLALCDAIRRGADLRIGTAFRHNEHIDTSSQNDELIREHMDFRVTYLLDDRWAAGIETLRMPVALPDGFGPRASMSFFLYNQDGNQAVGRPFLDGESPAPGKNASAPKNDLAMPKMQVLGAADEDTNAPSHHFVYAFDYFGFFVCDRWREVLSHDEKGRVLSGSLDDLVAAVNAGREIKVGIRGLCQDLGDGPAHEVFVHVGPCYHYTKSKFLIGAANPLVRVRPAIPLVYRSRAWDFGWLTARTDGFIARWLCNPYTLRFAKSSARHAVRWFADDA
jgi:hypothetical protein